MDFSTIIAASVIDPDLAEVVIGSILVSNTVIVQNFNILLECLEYEKDAFFEKLCYNDSFLSRNTLCRVNIVLLKRVFISAPGVLQHPNSVGMH